MQAVRGLEELMGGGSAVGGERECVEENRPNRRILNAIQGPSSLSLSLSIEHWEGYC